MGWDIDQMKEQIGPRLTEIVVLVIVLAPIIYFMTDKIYSEKIETLKERIVLAQERSKYFEDRLSMMEPTTEQSTDSVPTNGMNTDAVINKNNSNSDSSKTTKSLSKRFITVLADSYGLLDGDSLNKHLMFDNNDIDFWYNKGLTRDQLKREFESRSIALKRAAANNKKISSQGDLSFEAEEIQKEF